VKRELVLIGGLGYAFVWVESLAESYRWHHQGCLRAYNMVGVKCWDQIANGYSILNTERNVKVGYCALENDGCEGVNNTMSRAINVLGESLGCLFIGAVRGLVIMSKQPP
jgi:hypothetical protein